MSRTVRVMSDQPTAAAEAFESGLAERDFKAVLESGVKGIRAQECAVPGESRLNGDRWLTWRVDILNRIKETRSQ